jgi:DNA-binding NtrC family response regulator
MGCVDESTVRDGELVARPTADTLLVVGQGVLATYTLGARDLVIGRTDDCDVVVDDRSLSRRHAIVRPGPPVTVQDLGSTNGTQVAGVVHRGGAPVIVDEAFQVGQFAFVIVRRGSRRSSSQANPLVIRDPRPEALSAVMRDIAASTANLMIFGETGVGKEVLATTIHGVSGRRGVLTRINCAALTETLLESELFGHERGAFTGATAARAGLIEASDGGTVFLDEIGEVSSSIQAKLLRVVEHHEVLRLGSVRPIPLDVRFIAATNRDLAREVEAGRFRRDLYFRLDGVQLAIPPLRERASMIVPMAREFLAEACARTGRSTVVLGRDAVAMLEAHSWPGNVRELKAVIDRAVLLSKSETIGARQLSFSRRAVPRDEARAAEALTPEQQVERDRLVRALDDCAGNQSRAAKQLGISRTTMVTKLAFYRIKRPRA